MSRYQPQNRIASFDVFDTVLTRSVGAPASLFLLLGKRLAAQKWINCTPAEFAKLRVEAETRARAKSGQMEVTLSIIYGELCESLGLKYSAAPLIMEAERELEAEMIRIVPGGAERIAKARASQKKIIYVSDFYMPGTFVGRLLEQNGLLKESERCYVSADLGTTKASGEFYADVIRSEAVKPWRITHCGNHPSADIVIAKRRGLRVQPYLAANLNRYETLLENHSNATNGLSSVLAGASRLARLSVPAHLPREIALREVAAGVAAPTLTAYVLWILRRAQAARLHRLYFVARDGQILHEIARKIAPKLRMDLELRYLYGSRQAWHLPGVTKLDAKQIEWALDKTDRLTVGDVLGRVGLTPADIKAELQRANLTRRSRITNDSERAAVRALLQNGIVAELIAERAAALRIPLLAYLKQERMFDGAKWALVDIGWHGRLQGSLSRVFATIDGPRPRGFYFGLHAKHADRLAGKRDAYLFDARTRAGMTLVKDDLELVPMMEMFCAADHGSVIGFEESGAKINVLMREPRNTAALNWGLPLVQQTIKAFADNLTLDSNLVDVDADARPAIVDVLRAFWLAPTTSEAVAWGAYPYEDDQLGKSTTKLAQGYVASDAFVALCRGRVPRHHRAGWMHGSLALTDPITRRLMTFAAAAGSKCRVVARLDAQSTEFKLDAGPDADPENRSGAETDFTAGCNMSSAPPPAVSVILCTHNPRADYLAATLESLQLQSLVRASWELLVIDNASEPWLAPQLDLSWHPNARVIREETIGLVHARRRGIAESRGQLLVFVDDDNVLAPRYLQSALTLVQMHPEIGAFGGQILPRFETPAPAWTEKYWPLLAIRAFESDRWSNVHDDFAALPCGAGMCVRPLVAQRWAELIKSDPMRAALGRSGQRLLSGEDSDLAWTACDMGMGVGVFTSLQLTHLIPARRLTENYLAQLVEGTSYSNVRLLSTRGAVTPLNVPRQWMSLAKSLLGGRRGFRLALAAYRGRRDAHRGIAADTASGRTSSLKTTPAHAGV